MRTWVITLIVLLTLVIVGGCSSSAPEVSAALAPTVDAPDADARSTSALAWGSPIVVDSQASPGNQEGTSLAIIDGNPAVSYVVWGFQGRSAYYTLYYARANDPAGTSWGRPIALVAMPANSKPLNIYLQARPTSLCEVNGRPAIAYEDVSEWLTNRHRHLTYIRAADSVGKKWGTPLIVDDEAETGLFCTMKVVNGNPAITYTCYPYYNNYSNSRYIRALDPNGETWGTPLVPDPYSDIPFHNLTVANGHPAICYGAPGQLIFNRATDPDGSSLSSWSNPVVVQSGGDAQRWRVKSLAIIDGHPALAYSDVGPHGGGAGVYFTRALDADGSVWPADEVLVSDGTSFDWIGTLADIGGLPSIAFISSDTLEQPSPLTLNFIQATDVTGSAWGTRQALASFGTMMHVVPDPQPAAVGSGAGIAFMDTLHAMNYIGTLPAPPDPAVNVQLSTDKSNYVIGDDLEAVLTAMVTDEYGYPISGLGMGSFATTLDSLSVTVDFSESATAGTYSGNLDISGLSAGDHTVQTTVTDTRAVSGSDSATFSMNEPGSGGTMHVGDLDASIDNGPHNRWRVVFTVKIDDSIENPVGEAIVSFSLSGAETGYGQAITGSDGTASYQTGWIKGSDSVTFTVDDVMHAALSYSPGDNHDGDGDSDGTSITAAGP